MRNEEKHLSYKKNHQLINFKSGHFDTFLRLRSQNHSVTYLSIHQFKKQKQDMKYLKCVKNQVFYEAVSVHQYHQITK